MPETEPILDQNAVEVPLYTFLDAARYLHVPVWFVLSASDRSPRHPMHYIERFWDDPEIRTQFPDDRSPVFREDRVERISFHSLAALFVYSAVWRLLFSKKLRPMWYRDDAFRLFEIVHQGGRKAISETRIFTDPDWVLDQTDRIFAQVEKTTDRAGLLKLIVLYQSRVASKNGVPVRLFPFSRDPVPDAPRTVVIDPEIRFGRPTVKGAPADVLAERWHAGDKSAELAEDYGLTTDEVDEALRFEATPILPAFPFPFPPFVW